MKNLNKKPEKKIKNLQKQHQHQLTLQEEILRSELTKTPATTTTTSTQTSINIQLKPKDAQVQTDPSSSPSLSSSYTQTNIGYQFEPKDAQVQTDPSASPSLSSSYTQTESSSPITKSASTQTEVLHENVQIQDPVQTEIVHDTVQVQDEFQDEIQQQIQQEPAFEFNNEPSSTTTTQQEEEERQPKVQRNRKRVASLIKPPSARVSGIAGKKFICKECDKGYTQQSNMYACLASHSLDLRCQICNTPPTLKPHVFKTKRNFDRHMTSVLHLQNVEAAKSSNN